MDCQRLSWRIIAITFIVAVSIIGFQIYLFIGPDDSSLDSGVVRVVGVGSSTDPIVTNKYEPPLPPPAKTAAHINDQAELEQAAIRAFPMLYRLRIDCETDCMLIATLGPNTTTGNWPESQWPYKGNLERFLATRGYTPRGPVTIDQPGDNDTLLRVPISVPPSDARALNR